MEKPNILFIMTDHQRADSIGMKQCGIEVTPNLNKLFKESVIFTRAYNTCPLCVPCRTALATGKYPTHNGVVFNDWDGIRARDHETIHGILEKNGYNVNHIGVDHIKVKPILKNRVNFNKWVDQHDYNAYVKKQGISVKRDNKHSKEVNESRNNGEFFAKKYSNTYVSEWEYDSNIYKDTYFTRECLDVIENADDKPFALFINYWAPHPPLRVPREYLHKFNPDNIELPDNVGKVAQNEPSNRRLGVPAQLAEDVSQEEWKQVWSAHLGLVNYVDNQIGQILSKFEEKGLIDNTIIVFTSDHGDHLGQHSMYQKMEMYEQAIKVPLCIKIPHVDSMKIDDIMSNLDVLPTLLDELGIRKSDELDGISQSERIHNNKEIKDRKVFCQYSGNPELGGIRRAVITNQYKYIYDDNNEQELYNLEVDPLEMNNVANDEKNKSIVNDLHRECVKWGKEKGDWVF
ncbi:MAG: sulfatase-like hydrolase/transferase [Vallitalea sp.]|jgi:arylsulfatase A-like enzyme|nr:sulfatase-like hydrolase/transferase [Vallitalea sp.]